MVVLHSDSRTSSRHKQGFSSLALSFILVLALAGVSAWYLFGNAQPEMGPPAQKVAQLSKSKTHGGNAAAHIESQPVIPVHSPRPSGAVEARQQRNDSQSRMDVTALHDDWRLEVERLLGPFFAQHFVWDAESRAATQVFVERLPGDLDTAELSVLRTSIDSALEGEGVAFLQEVIVQLYQLNREEQARFGSDIPDSMQAMQERARALQNFRIQFLGPEVHTDLFGTESAQEFVNEAEPNGQYEMITRLKNAGRSRSEIVGEISSSAGPAAAETYGSMESIKDWWHARYERFLSERRYIDAAGLASEDKEELVSTLLKQHYAPNEIQAARAYAAMRENTDEPAQ